MIILALIWGKGTGLVLLLSTIALSEPSQAWTWARGLHWVLPSLQLQVLKGWPS